ncbi:MAG: C1 family peptidase, partial [Ancalomicrobiaceae bacterium]|nr:C1 family peptidase [Ancalomicrobiaceae bacterium]
DEVEVVAETDVVETDEVVETEVDETVTETDEVEVVAETDVVETDEVVETEVDETVTETDEVESATETDVVETDEVVETEVDETVTETDEVEVVAETDVVETDEVVETEVDETVTETDEVESATETDVVEADEVVETETDEAEVDEPVAAAGPAPRALGYLPTRPQPNSTFFFASAELYRQPLPKAVDLRSLLAPVIHQGAAPVAVADAVAAAVDVQIVEAGATGASSRRFIDFNTRLRMGTTNPAVPVSIQAALEAVIRFGASSETACPWDAARLGERPSAEAYTAPAPVTFSGMQQVPLNLNAWRQALAEGKVIVFGMAFVEDPDACTSLGGVVPMVRAEAAQAASAAAVQALACVGYHDQEKVFIVRNCWGDEWGDGGYAYLPYNTVMCKKFVDSDCWVLVPTQPTPLPKAYWSDGATPVTDGGNGIGVETNPIDAAAYWSVSRNFVRDGMVAYVPPTPDFARL